MQKLFGFTVTDVGTCACGKEAGGGSGQVDAILTKVAGAHLLHEAICTVLHLTLGAGLGH